MSNINEIEKQVIKELSKNNLLFPLSFVCDKKTYTKLRSIVLNLFNSIEYGIEQLIVIKLDKNFSVINKSTFKKGDLKTGEALSKMLDKLSIHKKVGIFNDLYNTEDIDAKFIFVLNDVRNAFAHNYIVTHKRYIYDNKNVVKNIDAFEKLVHRSLGIKRKLEAIRNKQPEWQEFENNIEA